MPAVMLSIVPTYAGIFGLFYLLLTIRAFRLRRQHSVGIGTAGKHGEVRVLARGIRAHANFAEYVPLCLLLISFHELQRGPTLTVHALCVLLLAGRLIHAVGISREPEKLQLRVVGMALTLTVLLGISVRLLLNLRV